MAISRFVLKTISGISRPAIMGRMHSDNLTSVRNIKTIAEFLTRRVFVKLCLNTRFIAAEKALPPIEPQKKMAQHSLALTVFL
jgi:hypothetical protein